MMMGCVWFDGDGVHVCVVSWYLGVYVGVCRV